MPLKPLISVILPVYNAEVYLAEAIASILAQTENRFELIVIDDASSDGSLAIIKQFADSDQRLQVICHTHNSGVSKSRNDGLAIAQGEFIALMDADDIANHHRFEKQLAYMQNYHLDICGSSIQFFGNKHKTKHYPTQHETIVLNLFNDSSSLATPSLMMKREAIRLFCFDETLRFGEDTAFYIKLALSKGLRFGNCPELLLHYRVHSLQASQMLLDKKEQLFTDVVRQLLNEHAYCVDISLLKRHLLLIKKKTPLDGDFCETYAEHLKQVASLLGVSNQQARNYWFVFCGKQLLASRWVAHLFYLLNGNIKGLPYYRLKLKALLKTVVASPASR